MSDPSDPSNHPNEWTYELPGVTFTADDGCTSQTTDFQSDGLQSSMLSLNDCLSAFNDSYPPLQYNVHTYPDLNASQGTYVELINGVVLHNGGQVPRKLLILPDDTKPHSWTTALEEDEISQDYEPNQIMMPQHEMQRGGARVDEGAGLPPHPHATQHPPAGQTSHYGNGYGYSGDSQMGGAPPPHPMPLPQGYAHDPSLAPMHQTGPPLTAALAHAFDQLVNSPPFIKFLTDRNQIINPSEVPHETLKIKSQALRKSNKTQAEIALMSPDARRKYERNQREKQRSFKISKQIKDLQEVLTSLQIPYKNDKFSVLMSAVDFISEIQRENSNAVMHNAAMKNILVQANEVLNRFEEGKEAIGEGAGTGETVEAQVPIPKHHPPTDLYTNFTANMHRKTPVDYGYIFKNVAVPMGIAKPDGKIADCNDQFISTTGYEREELLGKDISVVLNEADDDETLRKMFSSKWKRSLNDDQSAEGMVSGEMMMRKRLKIKENRAADGEVPLGIDIAPVQDDKGKCKHFTFTAVQLVG